MGGGRPHEVLLLGAPLDPWFHLNALMKDFIHVHFGFYFKITLPLGFPINRGGDELSTLIPGSHTHAMLCLALSLPPTKRVS
jgi:hypothetical protein